LTTCAAVREGDDGGDEAGLNVEEVKIEEGRMPDDLLRDGEGGRAKNAYEEMRGFKKAKVGPSHGVPDESKGTSGLAGLEKVRGKKGKGTFDRAVVRAGKSASGKKRG